MVWPAGKVKVTVQPLTAEVPVLVTVTGWTTYPVLHWVCTVPVAVRPPASVEAVQVSVAEFVVDQGGALAGEGVGHPGVLVGEAPDRHALAGGHPEAGVDDVAVVRGLGGVPGRLHAHVQLGDPHLEAEGGEAPQVLLEVAGEAVLDGQVALEADAVGTPCWRSEETRL
jgi:hypothetical protein